MNVVHAAPRAGAGVGEGHRVSDMNRQLTGLKEGGVVVAVAGCSDGEVRGGCAGSGEDHEDRQEKEVGPGAAINHRTFPRKEVNGSLVRSRRVGQTARGTAIQLWPCPPGWPATAERRQGGASNR